MYLETVAGETANPSVIISPVDAGRARSEGAMRLKRADRGPDQRWEQA